VVGKVILLSFSTFVLLYKVDPFLGVGYHKSAVEQIRSTKATYSSKLYGRLLYGLLFGSLLLGLFIV
jgi:hypothetical protein